MISFFKLRDFRLADLPLIFHRNWVNIAKLLRKISFLDLITNELYFYLIPDLLSNKNKYNCTFWKLKRVPLCPPTPDFSPELGKYSRNIDKTSILDFITNELYFYLIPNLLSNKNKYKCTFLEA